MSYAITFDNSTPFAWGTASIPLGGVPSIMATPIKSYLDELRNILHALDQQLAQFLELLLGEVEAEG